MQNSTRRVSRRWCAAMSLAAITACGTLSQAATYNWTGGGPDSYFSDPNNWDAGSGYPGSNSGTGDVATFGATVTSNQPSLDTSDSIGELIFQSTSGGWILGTTSSGSSGNILTLNGANGFGIDATAQTSGVTDIQANLAIGAAQTWAVGTGGTLQIDGFITGSSGLTVGSSGATGTVELTALSSTFTGAITVANGSTLQLGGGVSGRDGMVAGPISLGSGSVLTFDNVGAQTYSGSIGGSNATVNDNGTGILTLTSGSTGFVGTINIAGGATLQFGNGTTAGSLGSTSSTIALASGAAPVSTLTFDEPTAQTVGPALTGPTGSVINFSGPSAGVVTTIARLDTNFNGTANVLGKNTLQFGIGASGADGLFGTTSTIALAASTSVLTFNDFASQTYGGTISGPSSGGTINVNGPAASLTLTTKDTNFHGTVNVAADSNSTSASTATLKLGTGASGKDALFGTSSTIVLGNTTTTGQGYFLNIDENTTETFPSTITWPAGGVGSGNNVFITGPGALTLSGALQMNSPAGTPYLNFQGTGNVTITGTLSMPSATGNAYLISNNTGTVTMSGANTMTKSRFYMGGNVAGTTWTLATSGTIGTAAAPTTAVYISNDNFSGAAPNPVTFNLSGSVYSNQVNVGDIAGPLSVNMFTGTGTALISTPNLFLGELGAAQTNNPNIYGGLFVGLQAKVQNPTNAPYVYLVGFNANQYGYISVANGGTLSLSPTTASGNNKFYIGNSGNGMVEVGTLNYIGASLPLGTMNVNVNNAGGSVEGLILNQGGGAATASEAAELNVYAGGTLNYTPYTSNGTTIASGDQNFTANSLAGQFAAFNIIGGTAINNGINSPLTLSTLAGATGILNLGADVAGRQGKLVASYVRAGASDALAFINFNGGELEFSNNNSAAQGSLISANVAGGVYVFPGGATIGTNYSGAAVQNATIPVALNAPTGNGVANIGVTANSGYSSPPIVEITGGGGSDATAVAVLSGGQITIVVTNPGFGYTSAPTVTLLGDGATTAATATATLAPNTNTGGLTKVDTGTLILGASNTYGGPTIIDAGTLQFNGATNATNAITVLTTSTGNAANLAVSNTNSNNNIALAATILVGDVPAGGGQTVGSFTLSNTAANGFILNPTAVSSSAGQTLGGFGIVSGSSALGLTVGNQTVIAPGTGSGQAVQSLTATPGSYTTTGTNTASFNTGNKGNATGTATGALTIGNQSGTTTTLAGGGTYFWKLNMNTGGGATTPTPGVVPIGGGNVSGANWDALILDSLNVTATPTNAFTIQAIGFTPTSGATSNPVTIGTSNDPYYSWTIARVGGTNGNPPDLSGILANLSLNTNGLPAPAPGYSYYLTTQQDPQMASDSDIVVNYSPAPEPSSALLLASAAGLLVRRRRRSAPGA